MCKHRGPSPNQILKRANTTSRILSKELAKNHLWQLAQCHSTDFEILSCSMKARCRRSVDQPVKHTMLTYVFCIFSGIYHIILCVISYVSFSFAPVCRQVMGLNLQKACMYICLRFQTCCRIYCAGHQLGSPHEQIDPSLADSHCSTSCWQQGVFVCVRVLICRPAVPRNARFLDLQFSRVFSSLFALLCKVVSMSIHVQYSNAAVMSFKSGVYCQPSIIRNRH